ncbi:iron-containing alcohol dehydrogenase [Variovorax sp. PBL-H6]|uniref:iron-containing alcohol dehydrogenase n=1 Tax=Variovorax sp. PBL-H6 TaxID=434009 RepID=UPI0013A5530B|nr:iron-containing alcohol dehydrogenase [Variovorax sp. PBL-H6]
MTFSQSAVETVYLGKTAAGALHQEICRASSHRVVMIASKTLATATTCISGLQQALGDRYAGTFASIPAHSPLDSIIEAVRYVRHCQADLLVAVGGGSVIDAAKIVTLCLERDLDAIEDLLALRIGGQTPDRDYPSTRARLQLIAIPTTLSGAEFSDVAAATDHERRQKIGFKHRALAPRAIILDPAMSLHTPMRLWLSTGVRAMDHAIETLASVRSNSFCDALAESALRALATALPACSRDPESFSARLECLRAEWQAMIALSGGIPMGLSHAVGHALGGSFGVGHGLTSCIAAPAVLAFNQDFDAGKQHRIRTALGNKRRPAAESLDRLIRSMDLPRTLGEVGLAAADIPRITEAVLRDPWFHTNPRPLSSADEVSQFLSTLL